MGWVDFANFPSLGCEADVLNQVLEGASGELVFDRWMSHEDKSALLFQSLLGGYSQHRLAPESAGAFPGPLKGAGWRGLGRLWHFQGQQDVF